MKRKILLLTLLSIFGLSIYAQNDKCATMKHWEQVKENDPDAELRMQQLESFTRKEVKENKGQQQIKTITEIPVVVHVLYHTETENISDEQVLSQLIVLNKDFRLLNADSLQPSHPFSANASDSQIEFCMAQQDPNGDPTNGITRTYTDSITFTAYGSEKFTSTGGKDNWDPTKYLNLWVCNLDGSGGVLGYAAFPSDLSTYPAEDGVVIRYEAFGTVGTAGTGGFETNALGRTATHEVGHWLNLRHIWGDEPCGDDFCDDTPNHESENYECPSFPHRPNNNCNPATNENGEMYMNYMDYVDDNCMVMFSSNQSARMNAALNGPRLALLTSDGCQTPSGTEFNEITASLNIYPNPSKGYFFIDFLNGSVTDVKITVNNILGEIIYQIDKQNITSIDNLRIDIGNASNGIYFVSIKTSDYTINKKIIIHE